MLFRSSQEGKSKEAGKGQGQDDAKKGSGENKGKGGDTGKSDKSGGEKGGDKMPKIFYVNWFRQDENGKFMWPGYGENSRVLKWVFERCDGTAKAVETPIGLLPRPEDLDTQGLDIPPASLSKLLSVDIEGWLAEIPLITQYFDKFGDRLPKQMKEEVAHLEQRLKK